MCPALGSAERTGGPEALHLPVGWVTTEEPPEPWNKVLRVENLGRLGIWVYVDFQRYASASTSRVQWREEAEWVGWGLSVLKAGVTKTMSQRLTGPEPPTLLLPVGFLRLRRVQQPDKSHGAKKKNNCLPEVLRSQREERWAEQPHQQLLKQSGNRPSVFVSDRCYKNITINLVA